MEEQELRALPYIFDFWALPHQLPPDGDWKTWMILGGRGSGKTRAGAEWVRSVVEGSGPVDPGMCRRVALVGETYAQARDIMVMGDSGIIACSPPDRTPVWNDSRRTLTWPNGAVAEVYSALSYEALRGPQFDAAWADEIGCAAVDKGTNEPNKFLDPKSSESSLPKYSNGARDDLIQMQYLRALAEYWDTAENNPVSAIFAGRMVDTSRMFVWAWDARPYPNFPGDLDLWSDGENYARGHWVSGRVTTRSLASVVAEVCLRAGVTDFDVSELFGLVRGYRSSGDDLPRAALQPLFLASGVDVIEVGGTLVFRNRSLRVAGTVEADDVVETEEPGSFKQTRDPAIETPDRVRLNFLEADGNFAARTQESVFPDADVFGVASTELPLVLTVSEGALAAERWLSEMRVARDRVVFSLPPSSTLTAGDVVEVTAPEATGTYRIDRLEDAGPRLVEAVRVEPGIFGSVSFDASSVGIPGVVPALPVWPVLLDLPLLRGDESPEAPWVAAFADPWPGVAAVYASGDGANWAYQLGLDNSATLGLTLNEMERAKTGVWDRGAPLEVKLPLVSLSSGSTDAVLGGQNVAVIGDPDGQVWEVFQYRTAELVGEDTWALSDRLRGQRGTDGVVPHAWPVGSTVLIVNAAMEQLTDAAARRGVSRRYRVGPARKPVDHPSYTELDHVAQGIGLRPYRPVHLRASTEGGDTVVSWARQTRIDGDLWSGIDVPLGETGESYLVRVKVAGATVREEQVAAPVWTYSAAMKLNDGILGAYSVEVAQISDRFGPGLYGKVEIDD